MSDDSSGFGDPSRRDPVLIRHCEDVLARLADESAGQLLLALALSDDGFEIARVPPLHEGSERENRYASMASSIQALGEAVLRELSMGDANIIMIQGERGLVVQSRVPGHALVISAQFEAHRSMGRSLAALRSATAGLAARLAA